VLRGKLEAFNVYIRKEGVGGVTQSDTMPGWQA
jgi:hypothetical protein